MRSQVSSGHTPWLRLTVGAGLTGALLTAFRRVALLLVLMAAAVVPAFGNSPAVAGITATDSSGSSLAATGDVLIGHAGVLSDLVRTGLTPALAPQGITIKSQGGNSLAIARSIRDGSLKADLFGSADANANQLLTGDANGNKVRWFAAFARNAFVLLYSPNSRFLAEFEKAQRGEQPWYEPLKQPGIVVRRSNPDDDPGGYYSLLVAQLAEKFSGEVGLKQQILGDDRNPAQVIGPASGDVGAKLRSGEVDAVFAYASIAPSLGVPYLTLPPEVNLSDPAHEAGYASASFTNLEGTTFRGGVIRPSIAPVEGAGNAPAALEVLDYLFSADGEALLNAKGFLPGPLLFGGDLTAVPEKLRRYIEGVFTQTALAVTPPSPAVAGTVTTFTATVTPAAAGSVQFKDGDTPLGSPVTVTNGTASLTTRLPLGTHSLTAAFTPTNPAVATPSTSAPVPYLVYAKATTTTLTAAPNPAFQGVPVVLIARVAPFNAAGTVQFKDGTTTLGAPVPVAAGFAFLKTSTLTKGTHTLTAVFTPTNPVAFGPSTSPPVPLAVRSLF
ncbi:MAG: Ig-like domain repeat protein [Pseudonocardiaceae bacterium]